MHARREESEQLRIKPVKAEREKRKKMVATAGHEHERCYHRCRLTRERQRTRRGERRCHGRDAARGGELTTVSDGERPKMAATSDHEPERCCHRCRWTWERERTTRAEGWRHCWDTTAREGELTPVNGCGTTLCVEERHNDTGCTLTRGRERSSRTLHSCFLLYFLVYYTPSSANSGSPACPCSNIRI